MTNNFHGKIPRDSQRGREMERAKLLELAEAAKYSRLPGFFTARLARGLTPEQRVQSERWGLVTDELIEAASRNPRDIDVFVDVHDRSKPRVGQLLMTRHNPKDEFSYIRGRLFVGDNGPGDAAMARRRNGGLRYVSAGFTVPDPNDPHPENFRSRLDHVTLVDEPHDKEAEIFLCGHSTKDGATPHRLVIVSSPIPIDMSAPSEDQPMKDANPATAAAAPKKDIGATAGPGSLDLQSMTAKQVQELVSKVQSYEEELAHYRAQHESQMMPVVNGLHEWFKGREDLTPEQRALHSAFVDTAGKAPGGSESMRLWHAVNTENNQLKNTVAELNKKLQELTEQQAGMSNNDAALQRLLSSFQQQQRGGPHVQASLNVPQAGPASTLLSGHSSSAIPRPTTAPTDFAKMLAERTAYHTAKLESDGRNPRVKRPMLEQQPSA